MQVLPAGPPHFFTPATFVSAFQAALRDAQKELIRLRKEQAMASLQEAAANLEAAAEAVANVDMTEEKDAVAGALSQIAQALQSIGNAIDAAVAVLTA